MTLVQSTARRTLSILPQLWSVNKTALVQSGKCGLASPRDKSHSCRIMMKTRKLSLVAVNKPSQSTHGLTPVVGTSESAQVVIDLLATIPRENDLLKRSSDLVVRGWLAQLSSKDGLVVYDDDCPSFNNAMHCQDNMGAPLHIAC